MKRILLVLLVAVFAASSAMAQAVHTPTIGKTEIKLYNQPPHRTEIILPQVKGYNIYSDGEVTPRERVREAWYDGLDIIAITDHLELRSYEKFMLRAHAPYNPDGKPYEYIRGGAGHKTDPTTPIYCDLDATYDEARSYVEKEEIPIMVVRGTEIWRNARTIGEYNAFFLQDITDVAKPDIIESLKEARRQGAIVIHNHPAWRRKTSDKTELVDGIEVVNGLNLYPKMIDRCVDEKLTIFANTDCHRTSAQYYPRGGEIFRTMTFILAKECTEKAIKEALLKRRTIGYSHNHLIGEQMWLEEFLNAAVDCKVIAVNEKKEHRAFQLTNHCSVPFILRRGKTIYTLNPFQSIRVNFGKDKKNGKYRNPEFVVDNMWTVGDAHPKMTIEIDK